MIYILLLEKGKWYVGHTDRKDGDRFTEHFSGNGAKWTQLYKPIQVMEWREGTLADENRVTLEYMEIYGWWNVRGGSYCNVEMSAPPKQLMPKLPAQINKPQNILIPKEIKQETKKVFKNGRWITIKINESKQIKPIKKTNAGACNRCGRQGHYESKCFANTDIDGDYINSESDNESDSDSEEFSYNNYKKSKSSACYTCGRQGHYASNCYAETHKNGYFIDH